MASSVKTWVNNSPPQCSAEDLNGFENENNKLIRSMGLALDTLNNFQTSIAVSAYAANGDMYTDSGLANAYLLSVQTNGLGNPPYLAPPSYFNGMRVRFFAANSNTGASTVNVAGLGVVVIRDRGGLVLSGGEIEAGGVVVLTYDGTNLRFVLTDDGSPSSQGVPTGSVITFAGPLSSIPPDYLYCDGSATSRAGYAKLFGVIGITWGAGDTVTTFNIPDGRSKMPIGAGTGAGLTTRVIGTVGGAEVITQALAQLANHNHQVGTPYVVNAGGANNVLSTATNVQGTTSTGGNIAMQLMNPWLALNYIIKV